jgi:serine/threonine protein kinase
MLSNVLPDPHAKAWSVPTPALAGNESPKYNEAFGRTPTIKSTSRFFLSCTATVDLRRPSGIIHQYPVDLCIFSFGTEECSIASAGLSSQSRCRSSRTRSSSSTTTAAAAASTTSTQVRMLTQWWDADRIEKTVTRQFVHSNLLPEEIERLDRSLAFGDGLTDGTYWEWIDTKAKRIFMILLDLGVPDQIFGIIDDSWDDGDLPISYEHIEQLALTANKDERLEKKFFQRQFYYLIKPLEKEDHTEYLDYEVVPVDVVERRQGLSHTVDKVKIPNRPNQTFCRRRIPVGVNASGCISPEEFKELVNSSKGLQNEHMVSYWSSYTYQGYGYVLFTPFADSHLKNFLATTPAGFKNLPKKIRRESVVNWILCLVDTLAYLHSKRQSHGNIKPSTILFNNDNLIFFSDFNRLSSEALFGPSEQNRFDRESYDYAAPEQWFRPTSGPASPPSRKATLTSSSPEFTILGSNDSKINTPSAMLNTPNPHLNPQAADIFSLGCIILELLSFLLKRSTKNFAAHRSAKHKTPGRGGAVLDASYHKNLGQVESWMGILAKDAAKKVSENDGGLVYRGVTPLLHIVTRMLSANPGDRPAASDIQQMVYQVLTEYCDIPEPHCVHQYRDGGFDFAFQRMHITPGVVPYTDGGSVVSPRPSTMKRISGGYNSPRALLHSRTNSSGGLSNSGSSTASSERERERETERDLGPSFAALRNIQVPGKVRSPEWQSPPPVYAGRGDQASVY